eukprot:TRINITY_DN18900_c0_g1_i1.p1 TRINITY_DN18900_c0_g1~~TRINITY_DN18900_c0_g1_i1.p1  ORF type:complete len:257 (-),score=27.84 TRINITY_DN18900_c0_g1_i1:167-937(-)
MVPGPPPRSGSFQYTEGTTLRVTGLRADVRNTDLQPRFGEFGHVLRIHVLQGKGCAFVEYQEREDAADALKGVNGSKLLGNLVTVTMAEPPPDRRLRAREEQPPDPHLRPPRSGQLRAPGSTVGPPPFAGMTRNPPERRAPTATLPPVRGHQEASGVQGNGSNGTVGESRSRSRSRGARRGHAGGGRRRDRSCSGSRRRRRTSGRSTWRRSESNDSKTGCSDRGDGSQTSSASPRRRRYRGTGHGGGTRGSRRRRR